MMATTKIDAEGRAVVRKATGMMTDEEIAAVKTLVERYGSAKAGRMLGVARATILAIVCGEPVYQANVELVRVRLKSFAGR